MKRKGFFTEAMIIKTDFHRFTGSRYSNSYTLTLQFENEGERFITEVYTNSLFVRYKTGDIIKIHCKSSDPNQVTIADDRASYLGMVIITVIFLVLILLALFNGETSENEPTYHVFVRLTNWVDMIL